jgi:hypothetical protein
MVVPLAGHAPSDVPIITSDIPLHRAEFSTAMLTCGFVEYDGWRLFFVFVQRASQTLFEFLPNDGFTVGRVSCYVGSVAAANRSNALNGSIKAFSWIKVRSR